MNAKVKWTGLTNGTIDRVLHLLEGFQSQLGSERPDPREDTEDAQLWDEISDVTFIILREREQNAGEAVSVPDVKAMAYRFMGWKFPKDIYPDGGLKLDRDYLDRYPELWPTGTNLLHLGQAEEMVRYMLASAPAAPAGDGGSAP